MHRAWAASPSYALGMRCSSASASSRPRLVAAACGSASCSRLSSSLRTLGCCSRGLDTQVFVPATLKDEGTAVAEALEAGDDPDVLMASTKRPGTWHVRRATWHGTSRGAPTRGVGVGCSHCPFAQLPLTGICSINYRVRVSCRVCSAFGMSLLNAYRHGMSRSDTAVHESKSRTILFFGIPPRVAVPLISSGFP